MTTKIEGYKIEELGSGRHRASVSFVEYRRLHRRRWREVLGGGSTRQEAVSLIAEHIRKFNPEIVRGETFYDARGKTLAT